MKIRWKLLSVIQTILYTEDYLMIIEANCFAMHELYSNYDDKVWYFKLPMAIILHEMEMLAWGMFLSTFKYKTHYFDLI